MRDGFTKQETARIVVLDDVDRDALSTLVDVGAHTLRVAPCRCPKCLAGAQTLAGCVLVTRINAERWNAAPPLHVVHARIRSWLRSRLDGAATDAWLDEATAELVVELTADL